MRAEGCNIITEYGLINGKKQIAIKEATSKNINKSNETSPEQQAILEAKSEWQNRVERKYSESVEDAQEELFLPMLADKFKNEKKPKELWGKGIVYPCHVQAKLDGVRCVAYWDEDRIVLGTRSGKEWIAPAHIKEALRPILPKKMVLDGELYIHGALFEDLSSWTKKIYPETKDLQYYVFDMPLDENGDNLPWSVRYNKLSQFASDNFDFKILNHVPSFTANSVNDVLNYEQQYLDEGFEGCMARNLHAKYLFGYRSKDIQKVKSFQDDDYKVVGFKDGEGREKHCVIWNCVTKDGKPFDVRPKATLKQRKEIYENALMYPEEYVGGWLKVIFQNLTEDGIPRFPRSVGFRDVRDM